MSPGGGGSGRWAFAGACCAAVALVIGAYSNSFQNVFHFDDSHVIETNLYIRNLRNVPLFFTDGSMSSSLPTNAAYRPLMSATLALDYWLAGGLEVWQFHLSQLTMLVALGVALYLFYSKVFQSTDESSRSRYVALLAATLFCVHTANTEAMNIISVRAEILSAIGLVGSFVVYLYLPRSRPAYLYLLPMIVGAFAKSPAVMFAPLFCVYLLLFEEGVSAPDLFTTGGLRSVGRVLRKGFPSLLVGVGLFFFMESMNGPGATYAGGGRLEYLRTQMFVWLHYGRLFFLPTGLTADTDWTLIPKWYDTRVIAGILFVALLFTIIWRSSKAQKSRPVAFGVTWFMLALLPASSVFPLAEVSNEHRVFLPYIGLAMGVLWGLALLTERWCVLRARQRTAIVSVASAIAVLFVAGNAFGTYRRNQVWRSGETLWRDVTEKSPANGRGLMNYGLAHMQAGRYEDAKRLFERAQVFVPNYSSLEINLGIVSDRLGNTAEAEQHFVRALQLRAGDPRAFFFYGRWLVEQKRLPEAIPLLQKAISLGPGDIEARHLLLDTYAATARSAELKSLADETLALLPADPIAKRYLNDRGEVLLSAAPSSTPDVETASASLNMSLRFYQAGDFEGSLKAARRAIELQPDYPEAYNNMAAALASMGRWDEAITAAREALRLKPDFPLARNNLSWAETEKKKVSGQPG